MTLATRLRFNFSVFCNVQWLRNAKCFVFQFQDSTCNRSEIWRTRYSDIKEPVGEKKTILIKSALWSFFLEPVTQFDPLRMNSIDPMQNLFLVTGKHMMIIQQSKSLILLCHYNDIQKFVDSLTDPSDVGRIPLKIASRFSGFKVDQFKNWINIYSIPPFFSVLPTEFLEC